jgi:hypothetical protein
MWCCLYWPLSRFTAVVERHSLRNFSPVNLISQTVWSLSSRDISAPKKDFLSKILNALHQFPKMSCLVISKSHLVQLVSNSRR